MRDGTSFYDILPEGVPNRPFGAMIFLICMEKENAIDGMHDVVAGFEVDCGDLGTRGHWWQLGSCSP